MRLPHLHPTSLKSGVLFALLHVSACGGRSTQAENASASDTSPGAKCLTDASAPRTPRADAPPSIEVSHILIRHRELARPEGSTLTREEACLKALTALDALNSSMDWNEAVEQFSDAGKSNQGSLGTIQRDEVTSPFGDAAFDLEVDELSYVVETDRGFHVIWRTR